jgi:hypothetical protein
MVAEIFQTISEVMTEYVSALTTMFQNVVNIFYVEDTGLTLLGILIVIGFGIGIVNWAVNLIRSLLTL